MTDSERIAILCMQSLSEEMNSKLNSIASKTKKTKSTNIVSFTLPSQTLMLYATTKDRWVIKEIYSTVDWEDTTRPEIAHNTLEIMLMWDNIELSVSKLSPADKKNLIQQAPPGQKSLKFEGYDKNYGKLASDYIHATDLWINVVDYCSVFQGRQINNNIGQSVYKYLEALEYYERMGWGDHTKLSKLTFNELSTLLAIMG